MINRYFTLIIKDNYNEGRFEGKIAEVEFYPNGLHYIVKLYDKDLNETRIRHSGDLGYYEHKVLDNKLWNLIK